MCTSTLLVTAETRDAPEVEVLEGEVDLDDAGGLDARAQDVLLGGHVVRRAQSVQAVQKAARKKRPSCHSQPFPSRLIPSLRLSFPSRPAQEPISRALLLELSAQLADTFARLRTRAAGARAQGGQALLALRYAQPLPSPYPQLSARIFGAARRWNARARRRKAAAARATEIAIARGRERRGEGRMREGERRGEESTSRGERSGRCRALIPWRARTRLDYGRFYDMSLMRALPRALTPRRRASSRRLTPLASHPTLSALGSRAQRAFGKHLLIRANGKRVAREAELMRRDATRPASAFRTLYCSRTLHSSSFSSFLVFCFCRSAAA